MIINKENNYRYIREFWVKLRPAGLHHIFYCFSTLSGVGVGGYGMGYPPPPPTVRILFKLEDD